MIYLIISVYLMSHTGIANPSKVFTVFYAERVTCSKCGACIIITTKVRGHLQTEICTLSVTVIQRGWGGCVYMCDAKHWRTC